MQSIKCECSKLDIDNNLFYFIEINPIWTGLFANLIKRLRGGQNGPPPNLAISSHMTMKLGKDWKFTNSQKFLMTSSSS